MGNSALELADGADALPSAPLADALLVSAASGESFCFLETGFGREEDEEAVPLSVVRALLLGLSFPFLRSSPCLSFRFFT
jgi:hypothetical protein